MNHMKSEALKLFRAAVDAVDPYTCVKKHLVFDSNCSNNGNIELHVGDRSIRFNQNLYVAAFGKAALSMCRAVDEVCHKHIMKGIVSVPVGAIKQAKRKESLFNGIYAFLSNSFDVYEGAENNLPDQAAMNTAKLIHKMASDTMLSTDMLLVLISGGGSALLPLPIDAVSLDEEIQIIKLLQSKGANIQELNTVRQSLSQLKNGGLGHVAKSTNIVGLILSDVIGDPLEFIASGPTFYSGDKSQAALDIFSKYHLIDRISAQFYQYLKENQISANNQYESPNKQIRNVIVGSNRIALEAAAQLCHQTLTYKPFIATTCLQGEAREIARRIVDLVTMKPSQSISNDNFAGLFSDKSTFNAFQEFRKQNQQYCLLLGGETTVVMENTTGKGGRCQELALAAALAMATNQDDKSILLLAAGSDGIDGPTDAAGAFAYNGMISDADDVQCAQTFLNNHDSYTYLNESNQGVNLLKTGHTNTNVMDVIIVLVNDSKDK